MHIYVHTADQRHTLEVDPTDKIGMVKAKLEEKTGRTLSDHHLLFQEAVMEDDSTLHACGVKKKDVLFISQVCRGNRTFVAICKEILRYDIFVNDLLSIHDAIRFIYSGEDSTDII